MKNDTWMGSGRLLTILLGDIKGRASFLFSNFESLALYILESWWKYTNNREAKIQSQAHYTSSTVDQKILAS